MEAPKIGLRLDLVNNDVLFRSLSKEPKIINDIVEASKKDKDNLNRLIYTTYSGDVLSNVPSCECGTTTGGYNYGVICPACGTEVDLAIEKDIEPIAWLRAPEGVAALINPIVWLMLQKRFRKKGFEIMRWLTDMDYSPRVVPPEVQHEIFPLDLPRGYNNFVNNFDAIMAQLFTVKSLRVRHPLGDPLEILIKKYRDCIFSQYLPIPNRMLLVVEESNYGKFVDPVYPIAVNAVRLLAGIDKSFRPLTTRVKENRTVRSMLLLSKFYQQYYKVVMAKKGGIFRKHAYGTRCVWSGRAVISSITTAHEEDEIHIPWGVAVSLFRVHLTAKLKRMGWGPKQTNAYLDEYALRPSDLLKTLFQELITESPYKGIPCTIVRHPSLGRGSIQRLFITKVDDDEDNITLGIPITIVKSMNADFDGDNVSIILAMDTVTAEALAPLAPSMNTFSMSSPRKISGNPAISKPVVSTIANALHLKHPVDPEKLERMKAFFKLP